MLTDAQIAKHLVETPARHWAKNHNGDERSCAAGVRLGVELALGILEMKLLDGTESNVIRAEAAKRIREMTGIDAGPSN